MVREPSMVREPCVGCEPVSTHATTMNAPAMPGTEPESSSDADARYYDRSERRDDPRAWSVKSRDGAVATAHYRASLAGARVLAAGGNAVDATIAASLALAVCEPAGSGLGGMAMMVVHEQRTGTTTFLDGACRAPAAATPESVREAARYRGYAAVAVPTYVATLARALERFGTCSRAELIEPALEIAAEGYRVTALQERLAGEYAAALRASTASPLFLDPELRPLRAGTRLVQPALASTLARLADAGFEDFYLGEIAQRIDRDMQENGGFLRAADLAAVDAVEREPLRTRFGDCEVLCAGPPGGGLALVQMLNMLAAVDPVPAPDSVSGVALQAGIIARARSDRRAFRLRVGASSPSRAAILADPIYARAAVGEVRVSLASGETSHLSVIDRWGNAVALTQSIERSFGAAVATPELGFLYNGFLRAFKVRNTRHPHYLAPGRAARSNAAPTIALRSGRVAAALGSTGSERAVSGVFQVLARLRVQAPFAAVHAPRLHCTPEGTVLIEAERAAPGVLAGLRRHGFAVQTLEPYSFRTGGLQLCVSDGESIIGVADPRRDGAACAP